MRLRWCITKSCINFILTKIEVVNYLKLLVQPSNAHFFEGEDKQNIYIFFFLSFNSQRANIASTASPVIVNTTK